MVTRSAWLCCSARLPKTCAGWRKRTRSLARQVRELLERAHRAFGADYITNILRQQQSRREVQPPLRLKDPELNQLVTDPLSLAEYDAFILRSRK